MASPDEIVRFQARLYTELRRSDKDLVLAASDVMQGRVSGDLLADCLLWIMSKGHDAYDKAMADPDILANLDGDRTDAPAFGFEALMHARSDAFKRATGGDMDSDMVFHLIPTGRARSRWMTGDAVSRAASTLKARFPNLCAEYRG